MLEEVLRYVNNWFETKIYFGSYTIVNRQLNIDKLKCGQYFRIKGSTFNDGVYQYPCNILNDETFVGEIWALAIPQSFLQLVCEITEWNEKYADKVNSPFSSESFGGYSYTKGGKSSASANSQISWQSTYSTRLNRWRKI